MKEFTSDVVFKVCGTETWGKWGKRYQLQIEGLGEKPYTVADASLIPIPPDTTSSLLRDLREGTDSAPFSDIQEELAEEQIRASLNKCAAFARKAEMRFWQESLP